jgi:uncharacterized protein (DUF427 family)
MTEKRARPGPGQESVWDYPRPPRVEATPRRIQVFFGGEELADTLRALRVLETTHPPAYYLPREDVRMDSLVPAQGVTWCEWKGRAVYFDVAAGGQNAPKAAWSYPDPSPGFEAIRDHIAFYPGKMEACLVDGERARPQTGGFYGGWITDDVVL